MKSPILAGYRLVTGLGEWAAPGLLRERARRGKEDAGRLDERLGRASLPRPAGRLAWLHGASVGESLSLLPLAERLRAQRPDAAVLVTSGTRASAEVLADRLPAGVPHQYLPVDAPSAVGCFLHHWRPDLAVFAESELWPNLLLGARRSGAKLALIGARQSAASLRRWRRAPAAARALLGAFDLVLARDEGAAGALAALGARLDGIADPKLFAAPPPINAEDRARLAAAVGCRPVVLAASTHPGEEALILAAWAELGEPRRALLIIAPRHIERAAQIEGAAAAGGWVCGRRSEGAGIAGLDVYIADTLGELGLWCVLARLAVLGGSLLSGIGGHNPLEPARLGCPIASGRFVANWPIIDTMAAAGALTLVDDRASLAAILRAALAGEPALRVAADRARAFAAARGAETQAALDRVIALLPP